MIDTKMETEKLRGKVCRLIVKAASQNDMWRMKRYQYLNNYFFRIVKLAWLFTVKVISVGVVTFNHAIQR